MLDFDRHLRHRVPLHLCSQVPIIQARYDTGHCLRLANILPSHLRASIHTDFVAWHSALHSDTVRLQLYDRHLESMACLESEQKINLHPPRLVGRIHKCVMSYFFVSVCLICLVTVAGAFVTRPRSKYTDPEIDHLHYLLRTLSFGASAIATLLVPYIERSVSSLSSCWTRLLITYKIQRELRPLFKLVDTRRLLTTKADKIGAYLINSGAHHCVVWASDGCLYQDSETDLSRSTDSTHTLLGPSI